MYNYVCTPLNSHCWTLLHKIYTPERSSKRQMGAFLVFIILHLWPKNKINKINKIKTVADKKIKNECPNIHNIQTENFSTYRTNPEYCRHGIWSLSVFLNLNPTQSHVHLSAIPLVEPTANRGKENTNTKMSNSSGQNGKRTMNNAAKYKKGHLPFLDEKFLNFQFRSIFLILVGNQKFPYLVQCRDWRLV